MDFLLKPRMLAIILFAGVTLHLLGLSLVSAEPIKIERSTYCLKRLYGSAVSDSGLEYEFFKRFWIIDFKYQRWQLSDVYVDQQQNPPQEVQVLIDQSNEAIQRQARQ